MSSIPALLLESLDRDRKPNAFQFQRQGEWRSLSTEDFVQQVVELFHGLRAIGIKAGDRVAILSENRVEWAVSDYAAQSAGAIVVPIYPTLPPEQIEVLLDDCEARLLFVSSLALLEKVLVSRKRLPSLKYIVAFDENVYQTGVMRVDMLYKVGKECCSDAPGEFRREVAGLRPDDLATIVYTSGTTGVPKGAMLTHANLISNVLATSEVFPLAIDDVDLSFLPLSHIFQRHVDYAAMQAGARIVYPGSSATVAENIAEVRPTIVAGVPRFFEKLRQKILSEIENGPGIRSRVFAWAIRAGVRAVRNDRPDIRSRMAERLVFRKLREHLGGRLRWFVSGGAALEREVAEFFFAIGIPVLEGYGLTETSPVISFNPPAQPRLGTVGKCVGDVQVRIAADGEILVRGSNVMKGYFKKPVESAEALLDGWFHTGDIGVLDADGYLRVTDRKKDLIITSNGKNVAPQPIENRLKLCPYFDNVVLIGDRRNFISALIVPNMAALSAYAQANKIQVRDASELLHHREIEDLAMKEIEARTSDLAGFEKIRRVAFLDHPWTVDGGELTPTLKVRRSVVESKFRDRIDQLYAA